MLDLESLPGQEFGRLRKRPGIKAFPVGNELVLVASEGLPAWRGNEANRRALTLNESGTAIWELCDGSHTVADMVGALEVRFPADREVLRRQIPEALTEMCAAGFIEVTRKRFGTKTGTVFVIGIEDKPYFWWQTAIFLESFHGKLPAGWRTLVVVCNDLKPLSENLSNILSHYETEVAVGENHYRAGRIDSGSKRGQGYSSLNRVEALSVASRHVKDDDIICLLDSAVFLFGDINTKVMPTGCAATRSWHIEKERFFSDVVTNNARGIDQRKLLEAIGSEANFRPEAVNVFVTGKVAKNEKYITDCFRFAEPLYLLVRIAGTEAVWMSEVPCFALAMTANDITYEPLERNELLVSDGHEETIHPGTLYHYSSDPNNSNERQGAFSGAEWPVHLNESFLKTDFTQYAEDAETDHERYFFELARNAQRRLHV